MMIGREGTNSTTTSLLDDWLVALGKQAIPIGLINPAIIGGLTYVRNKLSIPIAINIPVNNEQ